MRGWHPGEPGAGSWYGGSLSWAARCMTLSVLRLLSQKWVPPSSCLSRLQVGLVVSFLVTQH